MLKPQNIVQAAEEDLRRERRNAIEAEYQDAKYERYAFHRKHVHAARTARELLTLALMDPHIIGNTIKDNTRMIYGDTQLLLAAIKLVGRGGVEPHSA
jgi:hypothetical protein